MVAVLNLKSAGEADGLLTLPGRLGGMICQSIKSHRFRAKVEWTEALKRQQLVGAS